MLYLNINLTLQIYVFTIHIFILKRCTPTNSYYVHRTPKYCVNFIAHKIFVNCKRFIFKKKIKQTFWFSLNKTNLVFILKQSYNYTKPIFGGFTWKSTTALGDSFIQKYTASVDQIQIKPTQKKPTSSPTYLFAMRRKRKRGPGIL